MLLLAVDTSGHHGSLALARGVHAFEVLETAPLSSRAYSAEFIPALAALLGRHGFTKFDIEGFAVVSGPGSFTGLRVGLAAVKGLAEILRRPIAAVSMLEVIAAQANAGGPVISAFDAGRKELYAGEYDIAGSRPRMLSEALLSTRQFSTLLAANPKAELISPDAGVVELAPMHLCTKQIEWPDAGEVARIGFGKLQAGEIVAPESLEANYLRRSDAEIFFQSGS
jgi:tRNA threonylcarbamoyladenosine biosynthesis protein TsaB